MHHSKDFCRRDIDLSDIVPFIGMTILKGAMIGWQGTRPIFVAPWLGKNIRVVVQIGGNGYIVFANPNTQKPKRHKANSGHKGNENVELGDDHVVEMVVMADDDTYPTWIASDDEMNNLDPGDLIGDHVLVDDVNS